MKRLGIVASLVLLLLAVPTAEATAQGLGVKGGLQWSDFGGDTNALDGTTSKRSAFIGGVYLDIGIGAVGIRPEVLYSRQGAKAVDPDFPEVQSAFQMDYIQVPVLLRAGGSSLGFFAGPYGALLLSSKFVGEFEGEREELDIKTDTQSFDYGVVLGLGYSFGVVGVEGRYTLGLGKLFKSETGAPELKHRSLAVLLTIGFGR